MLQKLIAVLLACACLAALPQHAAAFPERPIRMIVPFPPGGGSDTLARILARKLQEIWGQSVVVENKGGAQGSIGTAYGLKFPPDGYAITLAVHGALAINPHLQGKDVGFDVRKDMIGLVRATEQSFVMVARLDLPVKTLKELVDLAKQRPGKLTLGTSASGPQLVGELFKQTTGTDLLNVPYNGGGPATQAILGGHVDLLISNPGGIMQHIQSGKVRGVAVLGAERNPLIPDVPSALEQNFVALSDIPEWYGFMVPAGTPATIVRKLNADFVAALNDPQVQKSIRAAGTTPSPSTPEEFSKQILFDYERWGNVVKAAGGKVK
jgi:tripartite-type tricarboxylate transporter receptor subunit TctC